MKKVINIGLILCVVLLMNSCKKSLRPAEYLRSMSNIKELNKTITIRDIDYTFTLIPNEIMALKYALDDKGKSDFERFNKRLKELDGFVFVDIKMQLHDLNGSILKHRLKERSEYEQRVMYYEFYAKNDIRLVCPEKEIAPHSYQYENHMNLMPYNTIVMAFRLDSKQDFQIVFNDRGFDNLFLKANFKQADIDDLPSLNLN